MSDHKVPIVRMGMSSPLAPWEIKVVEDPTMDPDAVDIRTHNGERVMVTGSTARLKERFEKERRDDPLVRSIRDSLEEAARAPREPVRESVLDRLRRAPIGRLSREQVLADFDLDLNRMPVEDLLRLPWVAFSVPGMGWGVGPARSNPVCHGLRREVAEHVAAAHNTKLELETVEWTPELVEEFLRD